MASKMAKKAGYNERLFAGKGLRSYLHNSRFNWFSDRLHALALNPRRIVEIGCFDGRLLTHLDQDPDLYEGLDADWEGGLSRAQDLYEDQPDFTFSKSMDPVDLSRFADNSFDLGVALETMEHINPNEVDAYLAQLARIVDGHLLISVPNEKGLMFLAKWILKTVVVGGGEIYSASEVFWATFGRLSKVERNEHKGFDHGEMVRQIDQHFEVIRAEPIPFRYLPRWMGFTIGITAKSKG